jgi:hypothetical protein
VEEIIDNEFEKVESEIEDSLSSGQMKYEISTYPADFTLEVLCSKWKKGDIVIPDFQRKFVWNVNQSSKLIESFMLGLPVPPIFLYIDKTSNNLVIDGQQRLKSIFYFFGESGVKNPDEREKKLLSFKLKGLPESSPWYEKGFEDFSKEDKNKFNDSILRALIVKQINPNDNTSIYHIFERLNTGGTLLNNQEVRNCVYAGPFNQSLLRLNQYQAWRQVFTNTEEDNRQKDVELILRFFALHDDLDNYKKPIKDFMSTYFGNHKIRFMDATKILEKEVMFKKTIDSIIKSLGEKPFHVRNGLNSSVCDSVMIAFSENFNNIPTDIKQRYTELCKNEEYYYYTSKATNDVYSVKNRILMAKKILFGQVD